VVAAEISAFKVFSVDKCNQGNVSSHQMEKYLHDEQNAGIIKRRYEKGGQESNNGVGVVVAFTFLLFPLEPPV